MTTTWPPGAVATRFVELAERIVARLGSPRVRALHLPPRQAADAKDAEFCAIELEDGSIGFSYVRLDDTEASLRAHPAADRVSGVEAVALARAYAGDEPVAKAIGLAAINALSQHLFSRARWQPPPAGDSLGEIEPAPGEHVGMVGLFRPLIPRVHAAGARLTVLEIRPELAGEHGQYRVTLDPADLASCDKVVSTCTVLLNDSLDAVLAACRNARHVAIVGPTAGCIPDPLFERGVGSVGGRRVADAPRFREAFVAGGKWGAAAPKYVIAPRDYPGVDRLLDRAR
jgi:uncharacterized protein (DUF4213/DUF364 family)